MRKISRVKKAVIPAAGFGTRFLPATKAMPKEMLPIIDKPIIQYIVEELVDAGIEEIIIVTGYHKRSIEDHFDSPSLDLVENLKSGGPAKKQFLEQIEQISNLANFTYIRQKGPYGNGTPLLNVRGLIGNEPFVYTWSDDFIVAEPSRFKQLITAYQEYNCPVLAAVKAHHEDDYNRYGFAGGKEIRSGLIDVQTIIEKPGKNQAPSDLATVSGLVCTPDIFDYLDQALASLKPGKELYYNDALKLMLADGKQMLALEIENGRYYDTGNKLEYLKTVVEFALKRSDLHQEFRHFLIDLLRQEPVDQIRLEQTAQQIQRTI